MTDETVMMGLDPKRSDYPSYTKECLTELIQMILKSDKVSLSKLNRFVKEKEKIFIDKIRKGDPTIARPVGWNKDLKEYKKLTASVEGMLFWNAVEYHAFDKGSRGYLFRLSGVDQMSAPEDVIMKHSKYLKNAKKDPNYIVLPIDEPHLPTYFHVDMKDMLKFAWIDRYSLILKSLISEAEIMQI